MEIHWLGEGWSSYSGKEGSFVGFASYSSSLVPLLVVSIVELCRTRCEGGVRCFSSCFRAIFFFSDFFGN